MSALFSESSHFLFTVASAERSFSKLKLMKNFLRNAMSQERLNDLAILSVENEL